MTLPKAKTGKRIDWKSAAKIAATAAAITTAGYLITAGCGALSSSLNAHDRRVQEKKALSCQTARSKLTSRKIEPEGCWYRGSTECWCSGVNDLNQPLVFTCEGKACSVSTNTPGGTP